VTRSSPANIHPGGFEERERNPTEIKGHDKKGDKKEIHVKRTDYHSV